MRREVIPNDLSFRIRKTKPRKKMKKKGLPRGLKKKGPTLKSAQKDFFLYPGKRLQEKTQENHYVPCNLG